MKRKFLIIFFVLLFVVVGILGFNFFNKNNDIKENKTTLDKSDNNSGIIISGNSNGFMGGSSISKEDENLIKKAKNEKNINICKSIIDTNAKNNCLVDVTSVLSLEAKDDSICNDLPNILNNINDCKNNINLRLNNCDLIKDPMLAGNCNTNKKLNQATEDLDETSCETIGDPMLINSCISDIILKKAIKKKNIALCSKLSIFEQNNCKIEVSVNKSISLKDDSYCDKLSDINSINDCKKRVLIGLALNEQDVSLCKDDQNCINDFYKISFNKSPSKEICSKMDDKDECLLKFYSRESIFKQDIKICSKLFGNYKNNCESFYKNTMKELEFGIQ